MIDLKAIESKVVEVANEAGLFISEERKKFKADDVEIKGKNDLVSYVDKEAEKMIVDSLIKLLPEAGFITEEGTKTEKGETYNWIIDPLDGTTNFIHNLPVYATSIALTQNNAVVVGVVNDVCANACYHASKGNGAFCNGFLISASKVDAISDSLLATGFPYYNFEKLDNYLAILNELMKNTHGLRRLGSAALDLAYVASGVFEGFFEYNLNPWDVAGGILLVEEAGGKVTDFSGERNAVFGRELVASGAGLHAEFLNVIKTKW